MKTSTTLSPPSSVSSSALLPPEVHERLSSIAARERRMSLLGCAGRIAGIFLVLALVGMTADRAFRFFHPVWRWLATLTVIAGTAAALWYWRRLWLWRATPLAAAQAAEKAVPSLEERWSTLASLPSRESMRGADSLLARVRDEASGFTRAVPARTRGEHPGFVRGMLWLGIGLLITATFYFIDPAAAGVRWRRLLAPWSNASLTQVNVTPQPVPTVIPRHEEWELQAAVTGRPVTFADLFLKDVSGDITNVKLAAGDDPGKFAHLLRDPQESFSFRFRAGDGQTEWHRIRVADRPVIASATVSVTPPSYTRQDVDKHAGIPPSVRALEGSRLTVTLATGGTGQDVTLRLHYGPKNEEHAVSMVRGDDGHYRWEGVLTESLRFHPLLKNAEGLTNKTPPVCAVEVAPDRPPVVTLAESSATRALTPSDTVEVAFTAQDDVGVQQLEVVVKLQKKGEPVQEIAIPVPMGDNKGARRVDKRVHLDLAKLPLEQGMKISYAVRATDGKGTQGQAAGKEGENENGDPNDKDGKENNKDGKDGKPGGNGGKPGANGNQNGRPLAKNDKDQKKSGGTGADPGTMGMRQLDVGQCSCSSDKNLDIEGFTGDSPAFREKLSIPVLPVLEKITAAVKAALASTTGARQGLRAGVALDAARRKKVADARTQIGIAGNECEALATKTKDTPYVLIGLQLRDLRAGELTPADAALTESAKAPDASPPLGLAEVHLHQALDWLEKITKEAVAAERAEAAEALAQKLKQVHRIFLEDTMKLLEKAKAGGPGSPELGTIEYSEEYARLLRERMEKINEIMKEFAKLLESDPALLAKYLDQQSKGAMSMQGKLQDLQAEQQGLNLQTASLAASGSGPARANAAESIKAECLARYSVLSGDIARTLHSAVTWYPKDLNRDTGPGADFLKALRASTTALRINPATALPEIDRAVDALNRLGVLPEAAAYAARRREEVITIKLTGVWLEALTEAAAARNLGRIAELKQRELARRTREFAERIEAGMMQIGATWPFAAKAAVTVKNSLFQSVLPHQRAAAGFLKVDHWPEARASQQEALKGFATAAGAYRALIDQIAEELRKNPPIPPATPGGGEPVLDLEALRKLLDQEMDEMEDWGLPHWSSNIQIISDWQKNCSGKSGGGAMPAQSPGNAVRANQQREQELEKEAARAQEAANQQARAQMQRQETRSRNSGEGEGSGKGPDTAANRRNDWNRLPSELDKDLRQQNDHPPPEEYRRAVEIYFRRIGVDQSIAPPAP